MTTETLIAALAKALPKLENAKRDASNPHFKAKYATLASVIDAIQPIAEHGLWFIQVSKERDNGACFETIVIHGPSGDRLSMGETFVPADKHNAQGFGSAQSYARRYGLLSAFGLATEDDDGNAAAAAPPKNKPRQKPADLGGITGEQLDQIKALMGLQRKHTVVSIIKAYQSNGWQGKDFDDFSERDGAAIIKRLQATIDEERIATSEAVGGDDVPY